MTDMTTEKEQLAKLKGAAGAMTTALTRIARLEAALADQVNFTTNLKKTLGSDLHASFYRSGDYKVLPIHAVLDEQIQNLMKTV